MAGCRTVALLLPKPARQWVALFYRLLTAVAHSYVSVHEQDAAYPWHGWETVLFCARSHDDLWEVHLCSGSPFEQLTIFSGVRDFYEPAHNTMARGSLVGYTSIYAILKLYYEVFQRGHYVEVVAYSEDLVPAVVMSDLYVRVPFMSTSLYAELGSHFAVNGHIYVGSFLPTWPRCLRASSMHGITLPIIQSRQMRLMDWARQVGHLQSITDPDLYEEVYRFACYVCNRHYNDPHAVGVGEPIPEESLVVLAIRGVLRGIVPDEVYAELATALAAGPAQLGYVSGRWRVAL